MRWRMSGTRPSNSLNPRHVASPRPRARDPDGGGLVLIERVISGWMVTSRAAREVTEEPTGALRREGGRGGAVHPHIMPSNAFSKCAPAGRSRGA